MNFPEQVAVARLSSKLATKIRRAFNESMDGDVIARQWEESNPAGGTTTPALARNWALAHVSVNKRPLQFALARTYADGYKLGSDVAKTRIKRMDKSASPVTVGIVDWSTWKPGVPAAAALVKPRGGLQSLLSMADITVTDDIVHTKLDRIGTALATGLNKGMAAKEIAKMIDAVINDPKHALTIAQTEMNRAMSLAARNQYEEAGIEQVEWLVAEGCEDCQENADASPIGIDETFPTGDTEPPAHPNCLCALAPYEDLSAPLESFFDN